MPYVLIIDDEQPIRDLLSEVFHEAGFEVGVAGTGAEGLQRACVRMPDLVVTDILMPDREGLETILALKKSAPSLPIIAMSGGSARMPIDLLATAKRFGAARAYRKPFDPFELLADAQHLLGAARSPSEG